MMLLHITMYYHLFLDLIDIMFVAGGLGLLLLLLLLLLLPLCYLYLIPINIMYGNEHAGGLGCTRSGV